MRPFIVVDSETDPFRRGRIPEPFIWGVYDGKIYRQYLNEQVHSMIKFLSSQSVVVYAHNGGKFDWHFILPYLEPYDNIKIISGRIAQFRIGKAEFRDSYNILPVPLKAYEKEEFDYSLMEADKRFIPENFEKICSYLKSDCINLYNMINEFQAEYGRHLTQAGAAMAYWTKIVGQKPPQSTPDYFQYFNEYYFGGRVQCFRTGIIETDFSVYDINSAYPYAMLSAHPYGLEFMEYENELDDMPRGPGFFRILADSHGAFPYRTKTGLSFPADGERREFCVTGWELQAAIDTGTDGNYKVLSAIYHSETRDFSEYINYFYEKRLKAKATNDEAGSLFAKLLMNSLYGKFGANPENYADYVIIPKEDIDDLLNEETEYNHGGDLGPWLLGERDLRDDEMRYYNVATAASITGYVRAYLWRAIQKTGIEKMLYCDTDSIATESEGHELDTGPRLGQWKFEGDFDKAGIGGKKLYIFRGKKRANKAREYKTASKGAKLTNNQLWKVAGGEVVVYNPENPTFSVYGPPKFQARRICLTR